MNSKTTLYTIHLFKLIDPSKGFEKENRKIFFEAPCSVKNEPKQTKFIDFLMPEKYWDPSKTYHQNVYAFARVDVEDKLLTDTGCPKFLLKHNYSNLTPLELSRLFDLKMSNLDKEPQVEDPDKEFCKFVGSNYVSCAERRRLLQETPFVLAFYTESEANGCEHYYRNAFPVCKDCGKVYPCRFCHDFEEDHELVRHRIEEMLCLFCQQKGPIGMVCTHCNEEVSTVCCPVCKTLCSIPQEVRPAYHCDRCGCCSVGTGEFTTHCDKCNKCVDKTKHDCVGEDEMYCLICQEDLRKTISTRYALRCNKKHQVHLKCINDMLQHGQFTCPLDHKVIITDEQYGNMRARILSLYKNHDIKLYFPNQPLTCSFQQCYDCARVSADFKTNLPPICHACFGCNCKEVGEAFFVEAGEIADASGSLEELRQLQSGLNVDSEHAQVVRYLNVFRTVYKDLVPKIRTVDPEEADMELMMRQLGGFE